MTNYLFDTNIVLSFLRNDNKWSVIKNTFDFDRNNNFISIVTLGELYSIAIRNQWGERRFRELATP